MKESWRVFVGLCKLPFLNLQPLESGGGCGAEMHLPLERGTDEGVLQKTRKGRKC